MNKDIQPRCIEDLEAELQVLKDTLHWGRVLARRLQEGLRGKTISQVEGEINKLIKVLEVEENDF